MLDLVAHAVLEASTTEGPRDSAGSSTIVAVLGAGGLGAILAAVTTGLFSKRKLGAEATEIITNAATGVVKSMEGQLARAEKALRDSQAAHAAEMSRMAAAHIAERNEWRKVLQLHVAWDVLAIQKMSEAQLDGSSPLPPPPPVTPAQRFVDDSGYPITPGVD